MLGIWLAILAIVATAQDYCFQSTGVFQNDVSMFAKLKIKATDLLNLGTPVITEVPGSEVTVTVTMTSWYSVDDMIAETMAQDSSGNYKLVITDGVTLAAQEANGEYAQWSDASTLQAGLAAVATVLFVQAAPCSEQVKIEISAPKGFAILTSEGGEMTYTYTPPNWCEETPCSANAAECASTDFARTCTCNAGFDGTDCEINLDECTPDPCQNGGTCTDGNNAFSCACVAGYSGDTCATNVDECSPNPCVNGNCTDGINSFTCACDAGWEGSTCADDTDDCAPNPCQNGGTCTDTGAVSFSCACVAGYVGDTCATNVDECSPNPCVHGACTDGINAYTCACDAGWQGAQCDQDISDCAPNPCQNGGTCTDTGAVSFSCACAAGYSGTTCGTNINECAPNPCANGACTDGINSFTCACDAGWEGSRCDVDTNDCASNPCQNGGTCTDTGTVSFSCACVAGYSGATCATNINECAPNPCANGACTDGINAYTCACDAGWHGFKCDQDISDCAPNPCKNGGACTDTGAVSFSCACVAGYSGTTCATNINECAPNPCANGACTDGVNSFTCACDAGWEGATCAVDTNDCAPNPCKNGAPCTDGLDSYSCACVAGYAGSTCATNINECAPGPCQNGGSCADGINAYTCTCAAGWSGTNCQTNINDCAPNPCAHGSCADKVNDFACTCEPGWAGKKCDVDIDDCASNPCKAGGTCTDKVNGYSCTCASGYELNSGKTACQDVDGCATAPLVQDRWKACQGPGEASRGTCNDVAAPGTGHTCACKFGFGMVAIDGVQTCQQQWTKAGTLSGWNSVMSKYPQERYEYGIAYNGLIQLAMQNGWNRGTRVTLYPFFPMYDNRNDQHWGTCVYTRGLEDSTSTFYHHYYRWNYNGDPVMTGGNGNANGLTVYVRALLQPWVPAGQLISFDRGKYSSAVYEYGSRYNGQIQRAYFNGWNRGTRLHLYPFYPQGDNANGLWLGSTVYTKNVGGEGATNAWYHSYYKGAAGALGGNGNHNTLGMWVRKHLFPWTKVAGKDSMNTYHTNRQTYGATHWEHGVQYNGDIQTTWRNGWNRGNRVTLYPSFPMYDHLRGLRWGTVSMVQGLDGLSDKSSFYQTYYTFNNGGYPGDKFIGSNGYWNGALWTRKRHSPWIRIGTVGSYDSTKYPQQLYQYGITYNGDVQPVHMNGWNRGWRISTSHSFPMYDAYNNQNWGVVLLSKGLYSGNSYYEHNYYWYPEGNMGGNGGDKSGVRLYARLHENNADQVWTTMG